MPVSSLRKIVARPIAKDHDEKRALILNTAASIFAREGFDGASMNQVAKACGISKANIYHYYESKVALLFDLLEEYLRELRDRVCEVPNEGLDVEERLRRTIHAVMLAYRGADDRHRLQLNGLGALPEEQQKILRDYQREMVRHLSAIVRELAPERFGGDKGKLRAATMAVFGMLNWYYTWNTGAGLKARVEYAELVTDLTINGLRGDDGFHRADGIGNR